MTQWPHAPVHHLEEAGAYMVTAGTYRKQHLFQSRERLAYLHDLLLACAADFGWQLQAWAVFSNHYHFVAISPPDANSLKLMLSKLHSDSGLKLNSEDAKQGRQVWFNYWDTRLTFEKSYLARLKYVHTNPVHHGFASLPRSERKAASPLRSVAALQSRHPTGTVRRPYLGLIR